MELNIHVLLNDSYINYTYSNESNIKEHYLLFENVGLLTCTLIAILLLYTENDEMTDKQRKRINIKTTVSTVNNDSTIFGVILLLSRLCVTI